MDFRRDLAVGIVAIPLAMAFAIASGVPPEAGLSTAIIAGFLISSLGGARVAIGGPTGAFIVVLAGIAAEYGLGNPAICTILAGGLLIVMALSELGTAIKFIPYSVTMGFTPGIAVLVFSTQVKDFLGLGPKKCDGLCPPLLSPEVYSPSFCRHGWDSINEIPDDIGRVLAAQTGGVSRAVLEAVAVESDRTGTITTAQLQQMLGLCSRWETEAFQRRTDAYHD